MGFKVKVSLAQLMYKPSYIASRKDLLVEPFGDETTSISKLASHSDSLIQSLYERYISWIRTKVTTITRAAVRDNVDILVFPEYSVPPLILPDIVEVTRGVNIVVVAGSHLVTRHAMKIYQSLGFPVNESHIGHAIAPILLPNEEHDIVFKHNKSPFEVGLEVTRSKNFSWRAITLPGERRINLGVFICIDALMNPFIGETVDNPIIVVPSWSPKTQPFDATGVLARYNEFPLVYANTSFVGGSKVHAPFPRIDKPWFTNPESTWDVPRNAEAMITVLLDPQQFVVSKGTTREHVPATVTNVIPLLYKSTRDDCSVSDILHELSVSFTEDNMDELEKIVQDPLIRLKVLELHQSYKVGTLTPTNCQMLCEHLLIDECSYGDLTNEQANQALSHLTSIFPEHKQDNYVLQNISKLSSLAIVDKEADMVNNSAESETKPFYDRDEFTRIRTFFDDQSSRLMIIQGIRGIGKTSTVENISHRVLPPKSPWKRFNMTFTSGIGFPMFADELAYHLALNLQEDEWNSEESVRKLSRKLLDVFDTYNAAYLIIDDFQYVLDNEGNYVDSRFQIFIEELLSRNSYIRNKIILVTNRNVDIDFRHFDLVKRITLRGLKDEYISAIVDYYYRQFTGGVHGISVPQQLVQTLHGNPLAAIVAAQYLQQNSVARLVENGDVYRRFQEGLIEKLLEEVPIDDDEVEVIQFLVSSKMGISSDALMQWRRGALLIMENLQSKFMVEFNPVRDVYSIHPLIRDYFYNKASFDVRLSNHTFLAEYSNEQIERIRRNRESVPPHLIGDLIYHYASSMQRDKLHYLDKKYYDELRPVADKLFKEKKYQDALEYYDMLVKMGPSRRTDVLFRMSLCYGNLEQWGQAEDHFEAAVKENNQAAYMWADYGALLAKKTRRFPEAESYVMQAEEIYYKGKKRAWELAKIKYAMGFIRERQQDDECLDYYQQAVELDSTNTFYKFCYARTLLRRGDDPEASRVIDEGLEIRPNYRPLQSLRKSLSVTENESSESDDNDVDYE